MLFFPPVFGVDKCWVECCFFSVRFIKLLFKRTECAKQLWWVWIDRNAGILLIVTFSLSKITQAFKMYHRSLSMDTGIHCFLLQQNQYDILQCDIYRGLTTMAKIYSSGTIPLYLRREDISYRIKIKSARWSFHTVNAASSNTFKG